MGRAGGRTAHAHRRGLTFSSAVAVVLLLLLAVPGQADETKWDRGKGRPWAHVIVRMLPGVTANPDQVLDAVDGRVHKQLSIINGFSAFVPIDELDTLGATPGVLEVSDDAVLNVPTKEPSVVGVRGKDVTGFVDKEFSRSGGGPSFTRLDLDSIGKVIGADDARAQGLTGAGIDIALIDTGVAPVAGAGTTVNGPDLSFDSQVPGFEHLDAYGHGTHLAGIINGRGSGVNGIAPGARVVNVKVGAANGATDVVQVIAALDWVVQHRYDNGLNVRVIVLAYGTDSQQPYTLDPLAYAAEVAWRHGIVVVAAAGNTGQSAPALNNPAANPFVIAVGASDASGTYTSGDDVVAPFSTWGNRDRGVDVVAPGRSVVSFRDPGSYIDVNHPEGREPDGLFRGSGTSQASAVVAGSVALMLQNRPQLTPDQVKWLLRRTARPLPWSDPGSQGAGLIDLQRALRPPPNDNRAAQAWTPGTGTGSLEAARGSVHIEMGGVVLAGETDIFGSPWNGQSWSGQSWSGQSWSGQSWSGQSWSGQSWSGQSWSGQSWSGQSWSGQSWSGQSWSGQSWSGQSWSGVAWSGQSWSGAAG